MACARMLLDTNVVIDYLSVRAPHYDAARLVMLGGRVGEFDLWITASQFTDLVYILSDGGKARLMSRTLERLRGLRTFVDVCPVGAREVDRMLASSWRDPEDALLFEAALAVKADFLLSRNRQDFESEAVRVVDCPTFFEILERERGLSYAEAAL